MPPKPAKATAVAKGNGQPSDPVKIIRDMFERKYKNTTELFPDFTVIKKIPVIACRSTIFNVVTGVGGFPRGRITEIFGPESSGKTTVAIETAVNAQHETKNNRILFLDLEHAFAAPYAHKLGLNLTDGSFIFSQPDYFEQAEDVVYAFVKAGLVDMVVVDTMAAMTPKAVLDGSADDVLRIGLAAQLTSRFLDKLTKIISYGRKPAIVLLNQTRTKMDKIGKRMNVYEESASGKAMKFYSSIRIKMEIIKKEGETAEADSDTGEATEARDNRSKDNEQMYFRNRVRLTTVKNKVAPPWVRAQLVIDYGEGINNVVSVAELAERKLGILGSAGYFNYQGATPETTFSGRGREALQDYLKDHPEALKEIEAKVVAAIRQEQAESLGLTGPIQIAGEAKEIEGDTVTIDVDETPIVPSVLPEMGEPLLVTDDQ